MSLKEDAKGTNAYYWSKAERERWLASLDGEPMLTLDALVEDCPYRFVCDCATRKMFINRLHKIDWMERQSSAEKLVQRLRLELEERNDLEFAYWQWLSAMDKDLAKAFAERVLVSNL